MLNRLKLFVLGWGGAFVTMSIVNTNYLSAFAITGLTFSIIYTMDTIVKEQNAERRKGKERR